MEIIAVALIAGVLGPTITAVIAARIRRAEKIEDYARQDLVAQRVDEAAAQAAEAAKLLLGRQDSAESERREAAELLLASNERVAASSEVTNGKLDVIHTLVNSNMTAAMQDSHDSTVRELASLREIVSLKEAAGRKPDPQTTIAIEMAETKISELESSLQDRRRQAEIVVSEEKQPGVAR